jgi:hypothetical protein
MPAPRTITPVDQDLQNLYDEVWAGFAQESPSTDGDLDNIYSDYSGEGDYPTTPVPNTPITPQSTVPCAYPNALEHLVRD